MPTNRELIALLSRLPGSVRMLLARRRWIYWTLVGLLAVAIAADVSRRADDVERARDSWGATTDVVVAVEAASPGELVRTEIRKVPLAVVPEAALAPDSLPVVARQRIAEGEIVDELDVTVGSDDPVLAMTPEGWVVVPIVESPDSGAGVGERVQLVSGGAVLASEALVVGTGDEVTLLAVAAEAAPMIPVAAQTGELAVLRTP